jgi:hypothetical protein
MRALFSLRLRAWSPPPNPCCRTRDPRNDCGLCREMDGDFEVVEALESPDWTGCEHGRFCQGCIGRWMATMAMSRPNDVSPGAPLAVTVALLRPGGGSW